MTILEDPAENMDVLLDRRRAATGPRGRGPRRSRSSTHPRKALPAYDADALGLGRRRATCRQAVSPWTRVIVGAASSSRPSSLDAGRRSWWPAVAGRRLPPRRRGRPRLRPQDPRRRPGRVPGGAPGRRRLRRRSSPSAASRSPSRCRGCASRRGGPADGRRRRRSPRSCAGRCTVAAAAGSRCRARSSSATPPRSTTSSTTCAARRTTATRSIGVCLPAITDRRRRRTACPRSGALADIPQVVADRAGRRRHRRRARRCRATRCAGCPGRSAAPARPRRRPRTSSRSLGPRLHLRPTAGLSLLEVEVDVAAPPAGRQVRPRPHARRRDPAGRVSPVIAVAALAVRADQPRAGVLPAEPRSASTGASSPCGSCAPCTSTPRSAGPPCWPAATATA